MTGAVAALACDATRVVGLQLHDASGEYLIHDWVGVSGKGISGYATRNDCRI